MKGTYRVPELERAQAAAIAGVTADTFSAYVSRGQAPAPSRHIGRTPLWDEATVRAWAGLRPGKGSRATPRARARAAQRTETNNSRAGES